MNNQELLNEKGINRLRLYAFSFMQIILLLKIAVQEDVGG